MKFSNDKDTRVEELVANSILKSLGLLKSRLYSLIGSGWLDRCPEKGHSIRAPACACSLYPHIFLLWGATIGCRPLGADLQARNRGKSSPLVLLALAAVGLHCCQNTLLAHCQLGVHQPHFSRARSLSPQLELSPHCGMGLVPPRSTVLF